MLYSILVIFVGILPCFLFMKYIYNKDKLEKEPLYILLILFLGGFTSAICSLYLTRFLFYSFPSIKTNYYITFFLIALIEEGIKWLLIYLIVWKDHNFNHYFDPIVYSTFLALGFALIENVIYIKYYNAFIPMVLRGVISVPSHLTFGVFSGYYLALAKKNEINNLNIKKNILSSLIIPIILHYIYDILLIFKVNILIFISFITFIISIAFYIINKYNSSKVFFKNKKRL